MMIMRVLPNKHQSEHQNSHAAKSNRVSRAGLAKLSARSEDEEAMTAGVVAVVSVRVGVAREGREAGVGSSE